MFPKSILMAMVGLTNEVLEKGKTVHVMNLIAHNDVSERGGRRSCILEKRRCAIT